MDFFPSVSYNPAMVMVVTNLEFNPREHITAGQLRRLGFYVSEIVPEDSYVRRAAVGLDDDENIRDGTAGLRLLVLEPFEAYAEPVAV